MRNNDHRNNHANQKNPNNDAYWQARGYNERPDNWEDQLANNEEDRQVQERRHGAPRPKN